MSGTLHIVKKNIHNLKITNLSFYSSKILPKNIIMFFLSLKIFLLFIMIQEDLDF